MPELSLEDILSMSMLCPGAKQKISLAEFGERGSLFTRNRGQGCERQKRRGTQKEKSEEDKDLASGGPENEHWGVGVPEVTGGQWEKKQERQKKRTLWSLEYCFL